MYCRCLKRLLDVVAVVVTAPIALPVCALIAVLIRLQMGSPVLFRQRRPGLHECAFTLLKFRTMQPLSETNAALVRECDRITPIGRLLRKTSLDELPQLWNVLWGDMSVIGPRPLIKEYLPYYTPEEHRRHLVRPGITGWAQVNGRNNIPPEERLAMDVWYLDHLSWMLDLKILFITIPRVLRGQDVQLSPVDQGAQFIAKFVADRQGRPGGPKQYEDTSVVS